MRARAAQSRTPAVLVTGLPGSGKTAFVRRQAAASRPRAEIVTVDDVEALARRLRGRAGHRPVVIEARGQLEPLDLIDLFAGQEPADRFQLTDVIAVVDAPRFFPLLHEDAEDDGPDQTPAERLVNLIEIASVVALENAAQLSDAAEQTRIAGVIQALNPSARLNGGTPWTAPPGFDPAVTLRDTNWLDIPGPGSQAVDVFKYQARRPFHPARLADALATGWEGVLRTKGFVWIATRGDERGVYSQTGRTWRLTGAGPWWASLPQNEWPEHADDIRDIRAVWNMVTGDRRQELVFVGLGLRPERIRQDLDACLLDRREQAVGPPAWGSLPDPLPSWDGSASEEAAPPPAPATARPRLVAVD